MQSRLDAVKDLEAKARAAKYHVAPLAAVLRVSPQHLRRYILLRFGVTTRVWLNQLRVRDALALLGQAKLVKEVSAEMGFRQDTPFSRAFKQECGCSPRAYCQHSMSAQPKAPLKCSNMIVDVRFGS